MSTSKTSRGFVHKQTDPHYFIDYALLTGYLRYFTASSLEEVYTSNPTEDHARLFVMALYREEYSVYEDIGALINGWIQWRKNKTLPIVHLLTYSPGNVELEKIFKRWKINSSEELYTLLQFDLWIPDDWNSNYPDVDCKKVLLAACDFIFVHCRSNQNEYGISAYNQIKHGLKLFREGSIYIRTLPQGPAVLVKTIGSNPPEPYTMMTLPIDANNLKARLEVISAAQSFLRFISMLYVIFNYPAILKDERFVDPPIRIFKSPQLSQVMTFAAEVSKL